MDAPAKAKIQAAQEPPEDAQKSIPKGNALPSTVPSIVVAVAVAAIAGLSVWYLVRGEPLLVQGEVDATRFDMAARVDGRVGDVPVIRGQNLDANAVLVG